MIGFGRAVLLVVLVFLKMLFIAPCKKKRRSIPQGARISEQRKKKKADERSGVGRMKT